MIVSTFNFDINMEVDYNGQKYSAIEIISELYKYGYVKTIVRSDTYAWVKKRKKLYTTAVMKNIFKNELFINNFFRVNSASDILGGRYSKINIDLIKEGICDSNTIIKKDIIDSLDMITKDIYKKFMYPKVIVSDIAFEKIRQTQELSYNLILPEHHYSYNLFHKDLFTNNEQLIYKEIAELLDYYVPEGEDYREFCYMLLGEEVSEDYVRILLSDSDTQPSFLYGKFGGNDDTRRTR